MTFNNLYNLVLENSAPRSFSCLMLDLSFLLPDFLKLQEEICPCDVYDDEPGHGIEAEIHTTALYGIHTNKFSDITDAIKLKPVEFKIGKLSLFKNTKYDVLKFDIISKDLDDLNKNLRQTIKYTNNFPKFSGHITVAYLLQDTGKFYTNLKNKLTGRTFTSNRFIFSDSAGQKVWHTATYDK